MHRELIDVDARREQQCCQGKEHDAVEDQRIGDIEHFPVQIRVRRRRWETDKIKPGRPDVAFSEIIEDKMQAGRNDKQKTRHKNNWSNFC